MTNIVYLINERPDGYPSCAHPFIATEGNLEAVLAKAVQDAKDGGRGNVAHFSVQMVDIKG
jgi:hypothetical protein